MMNSELFSEPLDESGDNAKNSPKNDGFCFLGACLSGNGGVFFQMTDFVQKMEEIRCR